jgi:hypothetical protein
MHALQLGFDFGAAGPSPFTAPSPPSVPADGPPEWREIKERHPDALVLLAAEGGYALHGSDAAAAAVVLDLELSEASGGAGYAFFQDADLEIQLKRLVAAGKRVAICTPPTALRPPSTPQRPRPRQHRGRSAAIAAAFDFEIDAVEVLLERGATDDQVRRILRAAARRGRAGEGWRLYVHSRRAVLEYGAARRRIQGSRLVEAFRKHRRLPRPEEVVSRPLPDVPDDPVRLPTRRWGYRIENHWRTSTTNSDRAGENGFCLVHNPVTIRRLDTWARETFPHLHRPTGAAAELAQTTTSADEWEADELDPADYPPSWHQNVVREIAGYLGARAALLAIGSGTSGRRRRRDKDMVEVEQLARTVDGYCEEYERLFGEERRDAMLAAAREAAGVTNAGTFSHGAPGSPLGLFTA